MVQPGEKMRKTAAQKIEALLAKPMSVEKPLNRLQYIGVEFLGYVSRLLLVALTLSIFFLTDSALGAVVLCLMTSAFLYGVHNKFLPPVITREQAVKEVVPLLERLSNSNCPDLQKCVEQLTEKLNDPNISSIFWSKCYNILLPVNTAVCQFNEQTQQVASFVAIEDKETENTKVFARELRRTLKL